MVGQQVLTPWHLETTYGTTGGHPSHGEPSLDQLFLARPFLGFGRYRTPVARPLPVQRRHAPRRRRHGRPGLNAAREILRDLS